MKNATAEYLSIEDEVGEQKSYSVLLLEGALTITPPIKAASANATHTSIELNILNRISIIQKSPVFKQHNIIMLNIDQADHNVLDIFQNLMDLLMSTVLNGKSGLIPKMVE